MILEHFQRESVLLESKRRLEKVEAKMLNCPFCGSKGRLYYNQYIVFGWDIWRAECSSDCCPIIKMRTAWMTIPEPLVDIWNIRDGKCPVSTCQMVGELMHLKENFLVETGAWPRGLLIGGTFWKRLVEDFPYSITEDYDKNVLLNLRIERTNKEILKALEK